MENTTFDLLRIDGSKLLEHPYSERRSLLASLHVNGLRVHWSSSVTVASTGGRSEHDLRLLKVAGLLSACPFVS